MLLCWQRPVLEQCHVWLLNFGSHFFLNIHFLCFLFFMIGYAPHYFKLVSVQVLIRHGDRYPLYAIPKTKRPDIDCTLLPNR